MTTVHSVQDPQFTMEEGISILKKLILEIKTAWEESTNEDSPCSESQESSINFDNIIVIGRPAASRHSEFTNCRLDNDDDGSVRMDVPSENPFAGVSYDEGIELGYTYTSEQLEELHLQTISDLFNKWDKYASEDFIEELTAYITAHPLATPSLKQKFTDTLLSTREQTLTERKAHRRKK